MTEEQERVFGFFADSPYTYRLEIGFGEKGLAFESTAEGFEFPTVFKKPYVNMLLQKYYDGISRALECKSTDITEIVEALRGTMAGLPYPFIIEIRRKSDNVGVVHLKTRRKGGKGRGEVSNNIHEPAARAAILDFLDALSLTLGLAWS